MRTIVTSAICLAAVGTGAGVGAKIYDEMHVWLSGDKSAIVVHSGVIMRHPMGSELRDAIAHATFPVVFPVGVPAGTRVDMVILAPAGHPSYVTVSYQGKAGFKASFALVDPAVVTADAAKLPTGPVGISHGTFSQWRAGGEIVAVRANSIPADDLNRIKAAMAATSPRDSLAITETMLPKITVLGGTVRLEIAERYRPPNGRSVLLDQAYTLMIPRLAKRSQPMLDSRIDTVDNVKYAKGDLASAHRVKGPNVPAVSAGGVRAIDAVLRFNGDGRKRDCRCEVLFSQPSRTAYWVWSIPLSGPAAARKYTVDAKTFAVSAVPEGDA